MTGSLLPAPPTSVLLVRLSARGDVVFASPIVRAFRRTYPEVCLTWLVESHTRGLIEHHSELDKVIVWERARWKGLARRGRFLALFREWLALVRELRRQRFDLALDLQGLLRSGIMTFLSGARVRLGLGSKEGSRIFMTEVLDRWEGDRTKVSSEYRALALRLGLDVADFRMEVPLSPQDRAFAREAVEGLGLTGGYAALVPFTTKPQKHWFDDRWARVIDRIDDELSLPALFLGGPSDTPAADRIGEMTRSRPLSLTGKTSLTQAAAVIEGAALVLGVDTGLTHVSVAMDRPTVLILGSNHPYTTPPTDRIRILVNKLDCSPCKGNPTCDGEYTCLRLTTEDQVLAAAKETMAAEAGNKPPGRAKHLPVVGAEPPPEDSLP
jgi:heptosyltransferase-1